MEEVKTTENIQEQKPQNDDELYAKIQTEKLLKRRKKRKIITLVAMSVALVLAVCVIILAAVPVSLKPRCLKGDFSEVRMYEGTKTVASFNEDDARYERFMKAFNKSFSRTYLTALFSGSLFEYDINEIEDSNTSVENLAARAGEGNYFVRLTYASQKKLTTQSGKTFVSKNSSSRWDGKLTFSDVYLIVNSQEGLTSTKIYVVADYATFNKDDEVSTKKQLVEVTVKADTNKLFKDWENITSK